jgi:hypothetical protein
VPPNRENFADDIGVDKITSMQEIKEACLTVTPYNRVNIPVNPHQIKSTVAPETSMRSKNDNNRNPMSKHEYTANQTRMPFFGFSANWNIGCPTSAGAQGSLMKGRVLLTRHPLKKTSVRILAEIKTLVLIQAPCGAAFIRGNDVWR